MHVQFGAFDFGGVGARRLLQSFHGVDKNNCFLRVVVESCFARDFDETARFERVGERFGVVAFVALEKFFATDTVAFVRHAERNNYRAGFGFAQVDAVFVAAADFAANDDSSRIFVEFFNRND